MDLINDVQVTARIYSINGKIIDEERVFPVNVLDLSSGGMRAFIAIDLPVKIIIINVNFKFEDELFTLNAQIVRKIEKENGYEYGLKFILDSPQDENRLSRCVNQYRIKSNRFKKIESDMRKQRYADCFVKMLELIKEPSCLITSHRVVVAVNKAAKEMGVNVGEQCYLTLGKQQKICPHCQLDQALKADGVVETSAVFRDRSCAALWLHLENGLAIHYYTA